MTNSDIKIVNKNSINPKHQCSHPPYEYFKYQISDNAKSNKCQVSIYEIPPQKSAYPYHYHLNTEEVFYIISGTGTLETPDGDKDVSTGDVIIFPPCENGAHKLINSSTTEPLIYLDVDSVGLPDVVYYPNSNKVGILTEEHGNSFFKTNSNVDYYEGE